MKTGTLILVGVSAVVVSVVAVRMLAKPAPVASPGQPQTGAGNGWAGLLQQVVASAPGIVKTFAGGAQKPTTPGQATVKNQTTGWGDNLYINTDPNDYVT